MDAADLIEKEDSWRCNDVMQPPLQIVNLVKRCFPYFPMTFSMASFKCYEQFSECVKPQADLAWKSRQFDLSKLVSCLKQTVFLVDNLFLMICNFLRQRIVSWAWCYAARFRNGQSPLKIFG